MKPPHARSILSLTFLLLVLTPALSRAQGSSGPPHSGPPALPPGTPGSSAPGALGSGAPSSPSVRSHGSIAPSRGARATVRPPGQFGPVGRWWDDKSVMQAIGITREQQRKMDTIFDANKPAILESYKAFLKEQSKLESINKDPHADQATTFAAIDSVNNARATLQKATAQMLLQIRHEMKSEQIDKLEKLPNQ